MSEQKTSPVYLSNQLEELGDLLAQILFNPVLHPLQRRMVVVPSAAVKEFLFRRFATDAQWGVAAGMEVLTLPQALNRILPKPKRIPSSLELSLQLEHEIRRPLLENTAVFAPLRSYVQDKETRIASLAEQLGSLFSRYSVFGGAALDEWLKKEGWQQSLWRRIFGGAPWVPLRSALEKPKLIKFPIFVFGFSFLPEIYLNFFRELGASFYLLSPCQLFWGDLLSDREHAYTGLGARDENPLLANMGKVGRKFAAFLEKEGFLTDEHYLEPQGNSLLENLQRDLLLLRNSDFEKSDASIQLHAASSKWREVQVLYDALLAIFEKDPTIQPKEISVFAPDITLYAPYIHAVFGSAESQLSYAIHDLPLRSQSLFLQGFCHLLSLPVQRFDANSVLKLLEFPDFLTRFRLTRDDVSSLHRFAEKTNVRFGIDSGQRDLLLGEAMLEETNAGTWQHSWERLLEELALEPEEGEEDLIRMEEAELLGKWITILRSLKEDCRWIHDGISRPLGVWLSYLKRMARDYFTEGEEESSFLAELTALESSMSHLTEDLFSFTTILRIVERLSTKKTAALYAKSTQSVRFSSLNSGFAVPAQVICLLGMEEGAFPRMEPQRSLCEIVPGDYCPPKQEEDRYLFLEQLLSARKYFLLFYQKISSADQKEQAPSLLIQELFSYLDKPYIFLHPAHAFDARYFTENSSLKSYSKTHYLSALAHQKKQQAPLAFIPEFFTPGPFRTLPREQEITVDLKHLLQLARHPLQFYLERTLGLFLRSQEEESAQEEFVLPGLEKALLRKASLKKSIPQLIQEGQRQGKWPLGAFKRVAYLKVEEEVEEYHATLTSCEVDLDTLFSVTFSAACDVPIQKEQQWLLPAVKVPLKEGRVAHVVGKLRDLCPRGLLFHGTEKIEDLVKIWPSFLLSLQLPEQIPGGALLLTKSGKNKTWELEDPLQALADYLDYYEIAKENPSPLIPDWASALLLEGPEELAKAMRASASSRRGYVDEVLEWFFAREKMPSAHVIFERWAPLLRNHLRGII